MYNMKCISTSQNVVFELLCLQMHLMCIALQCDGNYLLIVKLIFAPCWLHIHSIC